MERIIWAHQSEQPFYVFDGKDAVHFWSDSVSIHRVHEWYQDANTRLSPLGAPHLYLKALPLEFYRSVLLDERLPISISMDGGDLGIVKHTSEHPAPAGNGDHVRRITRQHIELQLADEFLVFRTEVSATPAEPGSGGAREGQGSHYDYEFEFPFPLDIVPEVLDLTENGRRVFERNQVRSRSMSHATDVG